MDREMCLWRTACVRSVHETMVPEAADFPHELALAKPAAHDEFAFDRFINGLFGDPYDGRPVQGVQGVSSLSI